MADWDGLENRRTRKGSGGSNPSPSASDDPRRFNRLCICSVENNSEAL